VPKINLLYSLYRRNFESIELLIAHAPNEQNLLATHIRLSQQLAAELRKALAAAAAANIGKCRVVKPAASVAQYRDKEAA
jgi:hypothetical protein